ncbi:MAG TPA: HD domain-containing protein, partial [Chloroflexota bacterium]|nr:HD domain-containing protein [Chloroflexota bacterium]
PLRVVPSRTAKTPVTPPGARRSTLDTVTTAGVAPAAGRNGAVTAVTFDGLRRDALVQAFIKRADAQLGVLGYTEHGQRHVSLVANIARNILQRLDYPERTWELAAVAGYLHDIGNCVNRRDHATAGALMAKDILLGYGMDADEVAVVMGAIGNHEETTGDPVGEVSAALNIADKADVHRSRVREIDPDRFDIHDRVNFASQHSFVRVDGEARVIELEMTIDTRIAPLMDYFEIFLGRMSFIKRAVQFLECEFRLTINRQRML